MDHHSELCPQRLRRFHHAGVRVLGKVNRGGAELSGENGEPFDRIADEGSDRRVGPMGVQILKAVEYERQPMVRPRLGPQSRFVEHERHRRVWVRFLGRVVPRHRRVVDPYQIGRGRERADLVVGNVIW